MIGVRKQAVSYAPDDDVVVISGSSKPEIVATARRELRQRWELASVLNFLHVFEPVIGNDLKVSGEEIETALIEPNSVLAQLHIALLKGIVPSSKTLNSTDAWVVTLTRTLSKWWPWVAEGEFPLTASKGNEISSYKELEPATRLLILKALCEVRSDQHDAVSFIHEEIKNGTAMTKFQKEKLAGDGNKVSFWFDGDKTLGYRLYKEVRVFEKDYTKLRVSEDSFLWETIATNLEEFKDVMELYSSSKAIWEVSLSSSLKTDIIPIVEKHQKKKQKAMLRKQRDHVLLNGFRCSGISRSCRSQKNVDYTFENYDKAISEAIEYANEKNLQGEKQNQQGEEPGAMSDESYSSDSLKDINSHEEAMEEEKVHADQFDDEEYNAAKQFKGEEGKVSSQVPNLLLVNSRGLRFSKRLAGIPSYAVAQSMNFGAKKRSRRQMPPPSTVIEHIIVPDSDEEV